jgi:phosphoglycolate phosphatase
VGNGITKLLERALPEGQQTAQNVAKIRPAFLSYYDDHLADFTRPYPSIEALLHALSERGVKLAVASNKYQRATEKLVSRFFAAIPFAAVLGQRENIPVKPDAHIVREILSAAGETEKTCLYIGDSEVDMQTAHHAGVRVCAVTWGFRQREVLEKYTPDCWADCPSEILKFI